MAYSWAVVPEPEWSKAADHIGETLLESLGSPYVFVEMKRDLDPGRVSYATEYRATARLQDGSDWVVGWCDMIGTSVTVRPQ